MKITFAYPRTIDGTDYRPDETADVDDDQARQLVRDGFARPAERAPAKTLAGGDRSENKGVR